VIDCAQRRALHARVDPLSIGSTLFVDDEEFHMSAPTSASTDMTELAKAVLSTASDAIIATDHDGMITFWNPGAALNLAATAGVRQNPHHRVDRSAMASWSCVP